MNARERAMSVWSRRASGIVSLASCVERRSPFDIIEWEIRSAQQEIYRQAARLVLSGDPIEIARKLHVVAERAVRPT
jgi:hypothetical protein